MNTNKKPLKRVFDRLNKAAEDATSQYKAEDDAYQRAEKVGRLRGLLDAMEIVNDVREEELNALSTMQ